MYIDFNIVNNLHLLIKGEVNSKALAQRRGCAMGIFPTAHDKECIIKEFHTLSLKTSWGQGCCPVAQGELWMCCRGFPTQATCRGVARPASPHWPGESLPWTVLPLQRGHLPLLLHQVHSV